MGAGEECADRGGLALEGTSAVTGEEVGGSAATHAGRWQACLQVPPGLQ